MKSKRDDKRIVLIDQQPYWRKISADALKKVGFVVDTLDTYDYMLPETYEEVSPPDLVLLGCARIGTKEQEFIDEIVSRHHRLLVLCTSVTWQTMRALFLQGVDDILDKPYNSAKLVKIVNQNLESTHSHSKHSVVERTGAV